MRDNLLVQGAQRRIGRREGIRLLIPLLLLPCAAAQTQIEATQYAARRRAAMEKIPDGTGECV
ncbi:MAG TPA: hypothetical protein VMR62_04655 [Bryobacteraceae bacterium]|jgi:hypothetical protein|nr:hypothetical protein [Bryobacteraceae bacterium]